MSILEIIQSDLKEALRAGETVRRDTLRMFSSAIKNSMIEKRSGGKDFSDEDAYAVLRREVKRRNESATQYRTGGRPELADKEDCERAILEKYLPVGPDESAVRSVVQSILAETRISNEKDAGKVIGLVLKSLPGASGDEVRHIVSEEISKVSTK